MKPVFSIPIRVYYEDTDAGGVVYYANYLKFLERARTQWLGAVGFAQDGLLRRDGVVFAVRSVNIEFLKPARFNDLIEVSLAMGKRGNASVTLAQQIRRGEETLCEAQVRVACLDAASFAPRSFPETVAARLTAEAGV